MTPPMDRRAFVGRLLHGGAVAWLWPDVGRVGREDPRAVRSVTWSRLDGSGAEVFRLLELPSGFVLQGVVAGAHEERPLLCRYSISCTSHWLTRKVEVEVLQADGSRNAVTAEQTPHGRWIVDGVVRPDLRGCQDIDLGITPSTNTLPIRRLGLGEGERASMTAAWLRFPELVVQPLPQAYHDQGGGAYLYESRSGAFTAELKVDDWGLVTRYANLWERVGRWP